MRLATAASPTCCAPPVLIVMRQLVSPAAPNPAPQFGKLPKCTTPASPPAASNAASANSPCETGHDRSSLSAGLADFAEHATAILIPHFVGKTGNTLVRTTHIRAVLAAKVSQTK